MLVSYIARLASFSSFFFFLSRHLFSIASLALMLFLGQAACDDSGLCQAVHTLMSMSHPTVAMCSMVNTGDPGLFTCTLYSSRECVGGIVKSCMLAKNYFGHQKENNKLNECSVNVSRNNYLLIAHAGGFQKPFK